MIHSSFALKASRRMILCHVAKSSSEWGLDLPSICEEEELSLSSPSIIFPSVISEETRGCFHVLQRSQNQKILSHQPMHLHK